jgi:hypothetical protein
MGEQVNQFTHSDLTGGSVHDRHDFGAGRADFAEETRSDLAEGAAHQVRDSSAKCAVALEHDD